MRNIKPQSIDTSCTIWRTSYMALFVYSFVFWKTLILWSTTTKRRNQVDTLPFTIKSWHTSCNWILDSRKYLLSCRCANMLRDTIHQKNGIKSPSDTKLYLFQSLSNVKLWISGKLYDMIWSFEWTKRHNCMLTWVSARPKLLNSGTRISLVKFIEMTNQYLDQPGERKFLNTRNIYIYI